MFRPADDILIEHNDIKAYTFFTNTVHEFLITLYCAGDKIEKIEMGGTCCTYGRRDVHKVLVGKPDGKRPLGRPNLDGRIILRRIFRKWEGVVGTGWSWLRIGTGGGRL